MVDFIFPFKVHLDFGHHCNTQWYLRLYGGIHCVLLCAVHPDLGHPPDTQEYLGLLSEPFNTTQTFKNVFDNVLLEHGGLPHVLPLAVHLIFLPEQVEGVILSHFYSLSFLVRGLLHA